jgi:hypothetical protein
MNSIVHELSDSIYSIREKITDKEYSDLMDTLKKFHMNKTVEDYYKVNILVPIVENFHQTEEDDGEDEEQVCRYIGTKTTIIQKHFELKTRLYSCKTDKILEEINYCYNCKNGSTYCSHISPLTCYLNKISDTNKQVQVNVNHCLHTIKDMFTDHSELFKLIDYFINKPVTDLTINYDDDRDDYDDDSDLKRYNARVIKKNMYIESKIMITTIEKCE